MDEVKPAGPHLFFLDGLRALSALYVLMHHVMIHYYNPFAFEQYHLSGLRRASVMFFFSGHYAVNFFIVISGFSLMLSVLKNDYTVKGGIMLFMRRRIKRIIPPYYFATLLSLLLIWTLVGRKTGTHWDISIPVTWFDILTHLWMVHDFFQSSLTTINHAFWSIAVEFRIYMFFPLLVWIWRKRGATIALLTATSISFAALAALLLLQKIYPDVNAYFSGVSPYLILFVFGMLAAEFSFAQKTAAVTWRRRFHQTTLWQKAALLLVAMFSFKVLQYLIWKTVEEGTILSYVSSQIVDIILGAFYGVILWICTVSTHSDRTTYWFKQLLSWKPLTFVGSFSYSLYLIHAPLIQVISQYIVDPMKLTIYASSWMLMLLSLPLITLLAYGFHRVGERPFMK